MTKVTNPFMLPPLVQRKVTLNELLDMLRLKVNQFYMPTANGRVKYNSSPTYIAKANPDYSEFPFIDFNNDASGFYAIDRILPPDVCLYLFLQNLHIVINLKTLRTIVKTDAGDLTFDWSATPDKGIAIDRRHLEQVIDEWV